MYEARQHTDMPQSTTVAQAAPVLHLSRFGTYPGAGNGDPEKALRPDRWKLSLAAAFHSALGPTEVFLRNAIDDRVNTWNAGQVRRGGGTHTTDSLQDPARPLNSMITNAVSPARQNAVRARAARLPTPRDTPR